MFSTKALAESLEALTRFRDFFHLVLRHTLNASSAQNCGNGSVSEEPGYDVQKAAQLSAYLVSRSGGSMSKLKLAKLLYLSERRCAEVWGVPMFFDRHYSVKDGPICSNALDGVNGKADQDEWSRYLELTDIKTVKLVRPIDVEEELGYLSEADIEIADELLGRFGSMDAAQIRRWTHKFLPEYTEVARSRVEITPEAMAKAIGLASPKGFAASVAEARARGTGKLLA